MRSQAIQPCLEEARVNLELGRFRGASVLYRQVFSRRGVSPEECTDWGRAYYGLGDVERAMLLWAHAAQQGEPRAHFYLGEICVAQSNWSEAQEHFEQVLQLSDRRPEDYYTQKANFWLGLLYSLDFVRSGQALTYLRRAGQGPDAGVSSNVEAIAPILELAENSPGTTVSTRLGATLFGLGLQELAQAHLERSIRASPHDVEALTYLGAVMVQRGAYAEAESYLDKVLRLSPDYPLALYFQGKCQFQQGETAQARESFARLLAVEPQNAAACAEIARTYLVESKYALAEQWLEAAVKHEPGRAEFYVILAQFEATTAFDLNKGLWAARQATTIDPDNHLAFDLLGRLLYLTGQWSAAELSLQEAISRARGDVRPYYHLGELYQKSNRIPQARWAFGRAVDLGSDQPAIRQLAEQALNRLGPGPESPQ